MLAGIDVGSTGLKVSLFSEEGERLHCAYRAYSLEYRKGGRVTISPEVWWKSLCGCFAELESQCDLRRIEAIGISHANALIPTDKDMQAPFDAIMQMDQRGGCMVERISREFGEERIFSITGNRNAAGFLWGPTLKWLQEREEAFGSVCYLFTPSSYLVMRLTGVYSMDHTRAATTMLYDLERGSWSQDLCDYFHISREMCPPLFGSQEIVGRTKKTEGLCLPDGIPVTVGCMDTVAAMQGMAAGQEETVLILGSVGRFAAYPARLDRRFLNTQLPDRSRRISMTPVNNAGIAVRWIRDVLFRCPEEGNYQEMDAMAEHVPAASEGLFFFPYLTGSTCPHWEPAARGAFLGMEAFHTAGHYARAVLEGVGFSLWENMKILEQEGGARIDRIYTGGGGAKSRVWLQILSDIFQKELIVPEHLETETMGSAMLAGLGTGRLSQGDLVCWNKPREYILPRREYAEAYLRAAETFRELHPALEQAGNIIGRRAAEERV